MKSIKLLLVALVPLVFQACAASKISHTMKLSEQP